MPRFNLYLDDDQAEALRRMATEYRLSMSALLRLAIDRLIREPGFFVPLQSSDTRRTLEQRDTE